MMRSPPFRYRNGLWMRSLAFALLAGPGAAGAQDVDLDNLGSRGFVIDGVTPSQKSSGGSVAGVGDINGDGLGDLVVGAPNLMGQSGGQTYVVFGKADTANVDLTTLGAGGFQIVSGTTSDNVGVSVSGAGDVNGDGLGDLIVGASGTAGGTGAAYVVFGKSNSAPVNLAALGSGGFRILGAASGDSAGSSVSGAGDVNGDGLADLIVGDGYMLAGRGRSYVVCSASVPPASAVYLATSRNGNSARTPVGVTGDGSNDTLPDSRAWIDFADGRDLANRPASAEAVTLYHSAGAYPAAVAKVSWRLATTRTSWTSAEVRFHYLERELTVGDENTLQLVYSATGSAPFVPLTSVVDAAVDTISANISAAGYFYLGHLPQAPLVFADGFE